MLEIRCWSYSWECFHAFISDHSAPEAEWIGLVRCLRIPKTTTTSNSLHFLHYHRNIELPLRQGGRAGDAPFALWSVVGGAAGSYLPPTHVLISSSCVCLHDIWIIITPLSSSAATVTSSLHPVQTLSIGGPPTTGDVILCHSVVSLIVLLSKQVAFIWQANKITL